MVHLDCDLPKEALVPRLVACKYRKEIRVFLVKLVIRKVERFPHILENGLDFETVATGLRGDVH